jgi:CNT family concentrative nucleoside transporter
MGFDRADVGTAASLMGTQLIATEFVAYLDLAAAIKAGSISPRSAQMAAYALCGFANLPSIAIQIGGLSAMAPGRRADAASLGLKAMTAGALACWSTAAIAAAFL